MCREEAADSRNIFVIENTLTRTSVSVDVSKVHVMLSYGGCPLKHRINPYVENNQTLMCPSI
jgi:hypothetical protein